MESLTWTQPATWKRFGVASQADAETTRPTAYNQGFYNLFLALGALVGIAAVLWGQPQVGWTSSSRPAAPCCSPPPSWR